MSANITHLSDFTHMSTNISHLSGNTNISGDFQTSQFQTSQCTEMSVIFVFFTTSHFQDQRVARARPGQISVSRRQQRYGRQFFANTQHKGKHEKNKN